jgi:hypothetical protein
MSIGFSDPLVGGKGNLVRPYFQSPNFVANTSGWQITRAGSAQFNNLTVTGGEQIQGLDLFYSSTPPRLGTLVMSIAPVAGSDVYGNVYPAGVTVFDTFGDFIQETFGVNVGWNFSLNGLGTEGYINISSAGSSTAQQGMINFAVPTGSTNGPPLLTLVSESEDGTKTGYVLFDNSDEIRFSPQVTANIDLTYFNGSITFLQAQLTPTGFKMIGLATAIEPGTSLPTVPEVWHSLSSVGYQNTWTDFGGTHQVGRYKIDANNRVWLDGDLKPGTWVNSTLVITMPVGYRPLGMRSNVAQTEGNGGGTYSLDIFTNGQIEVTDIVGAVPPIVCLSGISFPVD